MFSFVRRGPFLLWGVVFVCIGTAMYLCGILMVIPRYLLGMNAILLPLNEWIVWYSGMPMTLGFTLILIDLLLFFPHKRSNGMVRDDTITDRRVTVTLTAYNDELSIGDAVADFLVHPMVRRVIVVSNNSTDSTLERAREAGAMVFNETSQGYGRCVFRCLKEAVDLNEAELIILCEGDRTFRASDIEKFLAYAPHADIVNGTRTVERLRQHNTQLSTFMYYGNLFVGKLLEAKHLGASTLTDVGTTYKLCRREVLIKLLPKLDPRINLEFNAYFLDTALANGYFVIECPITFHARVGVSKGGNVDNLRALKVGLRMIVGILIGWRRS
jgi:glycosyltransferase involved in cell wall biosynthesis